MYDVGQIRKAALAVYDVKPGPVSLLILLRAAERATEGIAERREDLGALIAYEAAQQFDKDFERYRNWLPNAILLAEQVANLNKAGQPPSELTAKRYSKLLERSFTGGSLAGVAHWAALANVMTALEGAEKDVARETSWLIKWWAAPASNLAATLAAKDAFDKQELVENYAKWEKNVEEKVETLIKRTGIGLGIVAAVAAVWFGWPIVAPILGFAAVKGEE